ncbi:MAG: bifunctional 3-deoxy-7-phosphoheptulonate synthase/chorismate mutase type II [Cyclobacteriaceae bacterium]
MINKEISFSSWESWFPSERSHLIIAGPCSAESPAQLTSVASHLVANDIGIMRAGVWKPRTRPNHFEGNGTQALKWLSDIKKDHKLIVAIEVASAKHVEEALHAEMDILWLGARTTVNPFLVQEIADALKGTDIPILVKNPINPELALWEGAIERIYQSGNKKIVAVHRGFSSYQRSKYRNSPAWHIAIELKSHYPTLPLICDPSHIAGNRDLVFEVSQKALDLGYDGLMIETHPDPANALSDADQQVTPESLSSILAQLHIKEKHSTDEVFISQLEELREKIDHVDQELMEVLAMRKNLIEQIGDYKRQNNVTVFQLERWNEILRSRAKWAERKNINPQFVQDLYKRIHEESIKLQTGIAEMEGKK